MISVRNLLRPKAQTVAAATSDALTDAELEGTVGGVNAIPVIHLPLTRVPPPSPRVYIQPVVTPGHSLAHLV